MLETDDMDDWKREKIGDYRALSAIVADCQSSMANDARITTLIEKQMEIEMEVEIIRKDRLNTIREAKEEQQMIKMELLDHWDIDGKTYKCNMGSASLRTKKIVQVSDQSALLVWLFKLERLEFAIRAFDMTYLKRLKDADMLPDSMAVYNSKTTVAITEAKE